MPKAVHDLATKLQSQGKSEDSAWAIANSAVGKTTKNDKNLGEMMQDQSPSMTNLAPSPQNTGGWPTSMTPGFGNQMSQMRENNTECDICGMPAHPPNDHPFLPRMPNDPMAMTQQPQMPMQMPMQSPMPQMPQQPPMQPPQQPPMQAHPAEEGGMGSGRLPEPGAGGGAIQPSSGGAGSSGGEGGGGGEGGFGSPGMGGGMPRPQPGPVMSFETDYVSDTPSQNRMNETIMKQLLDRKVGCGCHKSRKNV